MMQPSANGIAALFQGNPAALQQKVQKEQQSAKPGLPPDLKDLMALQILTEKTDAAQRQQAMNQLQQAGGPNMPTIAQSLQERAKQALSARMAQASQQPQPPGAPHIPMPHPEAQPEVSPEMMQQLAAMKSRGTAGVDQLPSNMGENYAGGGIIAFAGEEGSVVPRPIGQEDPLSDEERARLERELEMRLIGERERAQNQARDESAAPEEATSIAGRFGRRVADIGSAGITAIADYLNRAGQRENLYREAVRQRPGLFEELTPSEAKIREQKAADLMRQRDLVGSQAAPSAEPTAAAPQPQGIEAIIAQKAADLERQAGRQMSPEARALFTQREMNKLMQSTGIARPAPAVSNEPAAAPRAAPAPAAAPTGAPQAPRQAAPAAAATPPAPTGFLSPQEESQVNDILRGRILLNAEERGRMRRERAEKEVGAPETKHLEDLVADLAARRQKIAGRQEENKGFNALMRAVANAPRGLTSAGAGTWASEFLRNQEKELENKDFENLLKMVDTQAKVADVKRGWKKELFDIESTEAAKVYSEAYDAAKELKKSNFEAQKLAQEAMLKYMEMANQRTVAGIYTGSQMAGEARIRDAMADYKRKHPGAGDYEAYMAVSKPDSGIKGQMTFDQASDNVDRWLKTMEGQDYVDEAKKAAKKAGIPFDTFAFRDQLIRKQLEQSGSRYAAQAGNQAQSGNTRMRFDAKGNPI